MYALLPKADICGAAIFDHSITWSARASIQRNALAGKTKSRYPPVERLAASEALLDFESTCSNPSINLKYSGPSLLISASACLVSVSTAQTELVKGVFATAVAALAYISPIILAWSLNEFNCAFMNSV